MCMSTLTRAFRLLCHYIVTERYFDRYEEIDIENEEGIWRRKENPLFLENPVNRMREF